MTPYVQSAYMPNVTLGSVNNDCNNAYFYCQKTCQYNDLSLQLIYHIGLYTNKHKQIHKKQSPKLIRILFNRRNRVID